MEEPSPAEAPHDPPIAHVFPDSSEPSTCILTIKIAGPSSINGEKSAPISPSISISPCLNSPSPPSSAFVSALQSPYISPRALEPPAGSSTTPSTTVPTSTTSYSGSHSDDIPSTSYTPPSERSDFVADHVDQKPKFSDAALPRISFSFPVPRVSFTKGSVSPSEAKLHGCDVYIGYHGQNPNLARFCKWLKTELELQGIASFVADRARYSDTQSHEIADRIICSAAFGVIVVTRASFLHPLSLEEIRFFAQKKNLIPLLFDTELPEIKSISDERLQDKECTEAFQVLLSCNEFKLETNGSNWRGCISKAVGILKSKLGRKSIVETEAELLDELPFPRNRHFVGREKELMEIEAAFFGCCDTHEAECPKPSVAKGSSSDGFADEEIDTVRTGKKYISLEMRKCKEPTLEAWIEPVIELTSKGRSLQKQRSKHKKSRSSTKLYCINGASGVGKTELALEFAYRYAQRYKMVLWIGGETRFLRQNILNLSSNMGLDVSAEAEKERGRTRSFDEQEVDAFLRVKRELFRDIPYLLVIDNLETEKEWWEGKDLHDLIPRNTGATHVIVTTMLSRVMSCDPMQLPRLSLPDSLLLLKGRRKKDYAAEEIGVLKKLDERLGRLSFGLSVIGSLLSELAISPSELAEAIDRIALGGDAFSLGGSEDAFWRSNGFLMEVLVFCFAVLDRVSGRSLASRMVLAGAWLAAAPVSSNLLAAASEHLPAKGSFHQWGKGVIADAFVCGSKCCLLAQQGRKNETESALLLVKLGLAKRSTRQPGCWIQLHPITQVFAKRRGGLPTANAAVLGAMKAGNAATNLDHLWASAFLVFGFKSEPPLVQLKAADTVVFVKKTALPLAIRSFMTFSRCSSALELLKVCTDALEEVEKSFVSQIQDWHQGTLCWRKRLQANAMVDEQVWQEVTLLKATLLETRARLLLRGGYFDDGEELCRTCVSIRTVMLGHGHAQTLAAQETLAKLVRHRRKI